MDTPIKKIVLAYSGGLDTSVILALAARDVPRGSDRVLRRCRPGRGARPACARRRRRPAPSTCVRARPARRVRARLLLPDAARERGLRGRIPARHVDRAPADREGHDGRAPRRRRRRHRPRRDRQGQRPGALRARLRWRSIRASAIIAPWREWDLKSRTDCIEYAQKRGIPVTATKEKPYSIDRNLFHISYEGGVLEDPWAEPSEEIFLLTKDPRNAPDKPALRHAALRGRQSGGRGRQSARSGAVARHAQRNRWRARRRTRRRGREPLRRHEVARRIRDTGRHDSPQGPPRDRVASRSTAR